MVALSGDSEETMQVLEKEIPGLAKRWERLLGKENVLLSKSCFQVLDFSLLRESSD